RDSTSRSEGCRARRCTGRRSAAGGGSAPPPCLRGAPARASPAGRLSPGGGGARAPCVRWAGPVAAPFAAVEPIPADVRAAALADVDAQLVEAGLIDKPGGGVSKKAQEELGFERRTHISA